jgi:hypothetical protein
MSALSGEIAPNFAGNSYTNPTDTALRAVAMQLQSCGIGEIMSRLKLVLPAAILLGGFLICTTASYGTQEYMKQTKKACAYCHTQTVPKTGDPKAKDLTDAGKYFKEHKSLDGYVPPKK